MSYSCINNIKSIMKENNQKIVNEKDNNQNDRCNRSDIEAP